VSRWDTHTFDQVARIKRLWGDTLEKNLAVAKIVRELQISKPDYDHACLPFQYSWFRKLKKIANHEKINDPQYRDILPDARRTLYAISRLDSKLFAAALEDGMIHPRVTAEEIEQWRMRRLKAPEILPVKLTIRPKKTIKKQKYGEPDPEEPDEEERDILISQLRRDLNAIGWHLSDRNVHDPK
jgi:hypothetical protein